MTSIITTTRRQWCGAAMAAISVQALGGCGLPDGTGIAYETWEQYPDASLPPELRLVQAAILAASPHNIQPWRFAVSPDMVELRLDPERSLGAMDPLGREAIVGLGCAIENLAIAAPGFGRAVDKDWGLAPADPY